MWDSELEINDVDHSLLAILGDIDNQLLVIEDCLLENKEKRNANNISKTIQYLEKVVVNLRTKEKDYFVEGI